MHSKYSIKSTTNLANINQKRDSVYKNWKDFNQNFKVDDNANNNQLFQEAYDYFISLKTPSPKRGSQIIDIAYNEINTMLLYLVDGKGYELNVLLNNFESNKTNERTSEYKGVKFSYVKSFFIPAILNNKETINTNTANTNTNFNSNFNNTDVNEEKISFNTNKKPRAASDKYDNQDKQAKKTKLFILTKSLVLIELENKIYLFDISSSKQTVIFQKGNCSYSLTILNTFNETHNYLKKVSERSYVFCRYGNYNEICYFSINDDYFEKDKAEEIVMKKLSFIDKYVSDIKLLRFEEMVEIDEDKFNTWSNNNNADSGGNPNSCNINVENISPNNSIGNITTTTNNINSTNINTNNNLFRTSNNNYTGNLSTTVYDTISGQKSVKFPLYYYLIIALKEDKCSFYVSSASRISLVDFLNKVEDQYENILKSDYKIATFMELAYTVHNNFLLNQVMRTYLVNSLSKYPAYNCYYFFKNKDSNNNNNNIVNTINQYINNYSKIITQEINETNDDNLTDNSLNKEGNKSTKKTSNINIKNNDYNKSQHSLNDSLFHNNNDNYYNYNYNTNEYFSLKYPESNVFPIYFEGMDIPLEVFKPNSIIGKKLFFSNLNNDLFSNIIVISNVYKLSIIEIPIFSSSFQLKQYLNFKSHFQSSEVNSQENSNNNEAGSILVNSNNSNNNEKIDNVKMFNKENRRQSVSKSLASGIAKLVKGYKRHKKTTASNFGSGNFYIEILLSELDISYKNYEIAVSDGNLLLISNKKLILISIANGSISYSYNFENSIKGSINNANQAILNKSSLTTNQSNKNINNNNTLSKSPNKNKSIDKKSNSNLKAAFSHSSLNNNISNNNNNNIDQYFIKVFNYKNIYKAFIATNTNIVKFRYNSIIENIKDVINEVNCDSHKIYFNESNIHSSSSEIDKENQKKITQLKQSLELLKPNTKPMDFCLHCNKKTSKEIVSKTKTDFISLNKDRESVIKFRDSKTDKEKEDKYDTKSKRSEKKSIRSTSKKKESKIVAETKPQPKVYSYSNICKGCHTATYCTEKVQTRIWRDIHFFTCRLKWMIVELDNTFGDHMNNKNIVNNYNNNNNNSNNNNPSNIINTHSYNSTNLFNDNTSTSSLSTNNKNTTSNHSVNNNNKSYTITLINLFLKIARTILLDIIRYTVSEADAQEMLIFLKLLLDLFTLFNITFFFQNFIKIIQVIPKEDDDMAKLLQIETKNAVIEYNFLYFNVKMLYVKFAKESKMSFLAVKLLHEVNELALQVKKDNSIKLMKTLNLKFDFKLPRKQTHRIELLNYLKDIQSDLNTGKVNVLTLPDMFSGSYHTLSVLNELEDLEINLHDKFLILNLFTKSNLIKLNSSINSYKEENLDLIEDICSFFENVYSDKNINLAYVYFYTCFFLVKNNKLNACINLMHKIIQISSDPVNKDFQLKCKTHFNFGLLYYALGFTDHGTHQLEEALRICNMNNLSTSLLLEIQESLTLAYIDQKFFRKAYPLIQEILLIRDNSNVDDEQDLMKTVKLKSLLNFIIDFIEYEFSTLKKTKSQNKLEVVQNKDFNFKNEANFLINFVLYNFVDSNQTMHDLYTDDYVKIMSFLYNLSKKELEDLNSQNQKLLDYLKEDPNVLFQDKKNNLNGAKENKDNLYYGLSSNKEKENLNDVSQISNKEETVNKSILFQEGGPSTNEKYAMPYYVDEIEVSKLFINNLSKENREIFKSLNFNLLKRSIVLRDPSGLIDHFNLNYHPEHTKKLQNIIENVRSNYLVQEVSKNNQNINFHKIFQNCTVLTALQRYLKLTSVSSMMKTEKYKTLSKSILRNLSLDKEIEIRRRTSKFNRKVKYSDFLNAVLDKIPFNDMNKANHLLFAVYETLEDDYLLYLINNPELLLKFMYNDTTLFAKEGREIIRRTLKDSFIIGNNTNKEANITKDVNESYNFQSLNNSISLSPTNDRKHNLFNKFDQVEGLDLTRPSCIKRLFKKRSYSLWDVKDDVNYDIKALESLAAASQNRTHVVGKNNENVGGARLSFAPIMQNTTTSITSNNINNINDNQRNDIKYDYKEKITSSIVSIVSSGRFGNNENEVISNLLQKQSTMPLPEKSMLLLRNAMKKISLKLFNLEDEDFIMNYKANYSYNRSNSIDNGNFSDNKKKLSKKSTINKNSNTKVTDTKNNKENDTREDINEDNKELNDIINEDENEINKLRQEYAFISKGVKNSFFQINTNSILNSLSTNRDFSFNINDKNNRKYIKKSSLISSLNQKKNKKQKIVFYLDDKRSKKPNIAKRISSYLKDNNNSISIKVNDNFNYKLNSSISDEDIEAIQEEDSYKSDSIISKKKRKSELFDQSLVNIRSNFEDFIDINDIEDNDIKNFNEDFDLNFSKDLKLEKKYNTFDLCLNPCALLLFDEIYNGNLESDSDVGEGNSNVNRDFNKNWEEQSSDRNINNIKSTNSKNTNTISNNQRTHTNNTLKSRKSSQNNNYKKSNSSSNNNKNKEGKLITYIKGNKVGRSICKASIIPEFRRSIIQQSNRLKDMTKRASINIRNSIMKRKSQLNDDLMRIKSQMKRKKKRSIYSSDNNDIDEDANESNSQYNEENEEENEEDDEYIDEENDYNNKSLFENNNNNNNNINEKVDDEAAKRRKSLAKFNDFLNFKIDKSKIKIEEKVNKSRKRKTFKTMKVPPLSLGKSFGNSNFYKNNNNNNNSSSSNNEMQYKRKNNKNQSVIEHSPTYKTIIKNDLNLKRNIDSVSSYSKFIIDNNNSNEINEINEIYEYNSNNNKINFNSKNNIVKRLNSNKDIKNIINNNSNFYKDDVNSNKNTLRLGSVSSLQNIDNNNNTNANKNKLSPDHIFNLNILKTQTDKDSAAITSKTNRHLSSQNDINDKDKANIDNYFNNNKYIIFDNNDNDNNFDIQISDVSQHTKDINNDDTKEFKDYKAKSGYTTVDNLNKIFSDDYSEKQEKETNDGEKKNKSSFKYIKFGKVVNNSVNSNSINIGKVSNTVINKPSLDLSSSLLVNTRLTNKKDRSIINFTQAANKNNINNSTVNMSVLNSNLNSNIQNSTIDNNDNISNNKITDIKINLPQGLLIKNQNNYSRDLKKINSILFKNANNSYGTNSLFEGENDFLKDKPKRGNGKRNTLLSHNSSLLSSNNKQDISQNSSKSSINASFNQNSNIKISSRYNQLMSNSKFYSSMFTLVSKERETQFKLFLTKYKLSVERIFINILQMNLNSYNLDLIMSIFDSTEEIDYLISMLNQNKDKFYNVETNSLYFNNAQLTEQLVYLFSLISNITLRLKTVKFSYTYKDYILEIENLTDQLQSNLNILKNDGKIKEWYVMIYEYAVKYELINNKEEEVKNNITNNNDNDANSNILNTMSNRSLAISSLNIDQNNKSKSSLNNVNISDINNKQKPMSYSISDLINISEKKSSLTFKYFNSYISCSKKLKDTTIKNFSLLKLIISDMILSKKPNLRNYMSVRFKFPISQNFVSQLLNIYTLFNNTCMEIEGLSESSLAEINLSKLIKIGISGFSKIKENLVDNKNVFLNSLMPKLHNSLLKMQKLMFGLEETHIEVCEIYNINPEEVDADQLLLIFGKLFDNIKYGYDVLIREII